MVNRKNPYANWDRDTEGNLAPPALLTHCGDGAMEAEITVSMLASFGIPAVTELPGDGRFGKIIIGHSGYGVDIFVPATRLNEAKELLEAEDITEAELSKTDEGDTAL